MKFVLETNNKLLWFQENRYDVLKAKYDDIFEFLIQRCNSDIYIYILFSKMKTKGNQTKENEDNQKIYANVGKFIQGSQVYTKR